MRIIVIEIAVALQLVHATTCGDIKNLYQAFQSSATGCCDVDDDYVRTDLNCGTAEIDTSVDIGVASIASSLAGSNVAGDNGISGPSQARSVMDFGNGLVLQGHGCSAVSITEKSTGSVLSVFKPPAPPAPSKLHFTDSGVENVITNNTWTMIGGQYHFEVKEMNPVLGETCLGISIPGDRNMTWETLDQGTLNGWLATDKKYKDYMVDMYARVELAPDQTPADITCEADGADSNGGVMLRTMPVEVMRDGWPKSYTQARGIQFEVDGGWWRGCPDSAVMTGLMWGEGWAGTNDATYTQNERGAMCWESLYVSAEEQKTFAPVTEWNHLQLKMVGNTMESWVNGHYMGKHVDNGDYGLSLLEGHFAVQQHVGPSTGVTQGAMQYACIKAKHL